MPHAGVVYRVDPTGQETVQCIIFTGGTDGGGHAGCTNGPAGLRRTLSVKRRRTVVGLVKFAIERNLTANQSANVAARPQIHSRTEVPPIISAQINRTVVYSIDRNLASVFKYVKCLLCSTGITRVCSTDTLPVGRA